MEIKRDLRDFGGADLWSSFGRLCISTPMESMIPERELSKRVTVSSRSNLGVPRVRCDSNCITPKRGSSLQMRLSLDGNRKGFQRLSGCWFMIVIWPSVYIHPYGIYDPRMRTIQESDGFLEKQSRSAKSLMRFKLHHSKERLKLTGYYVVLFYCLVWAKKVMLAAICLDISSASFGIRIN